MGDNEGTMLYKQTRRRRDALRTRTKRKKKGALRHGTSYLLIFSLVGAVFTASFLLPGRSRSRVRLSLSTPESLPPTAVADVPGVVNPQADVTVTRLNRDDVPLVLVSGGIAGTRRFPRRQGVSQFVAASGAAAGVNGTFFADASLHGDDNTLIGPSLCGDEGRLVTGAGDHRAALIGRPLVLLSPAQTRVVPYDPGTMDTDADLQSELPGVSDAFLGGVWLVHDGVAVSRAGMSRFHVLDADDPRRRAFFGLTADGRPVLGATADVTRSPALAKALQEAGLREAVLLDSGFSTSLVVKNKVLVTGHTLPGLPSRPVPHALVLFDKPRMAKAKTLPSAGRT